MKALIPPDELQRLAALRQYDVLDTVPELAFDDLTLLASSFCQTPIAMVALVDKDRLWFKSKIGINITEISRDIAFCAHSILNPHEVMEVRDASTDPRFSNNPLVTSDLHIRFYAGTPLVTNSGHVLGTLCVMDRQPQTLTAERLAALRALGRNVIAQLELRRSAVELAKEVTERQRAETLLQQQFTDLSAAKQEADRLLALGEKSRRALLSVLEDETRTSQNLRASEERFRQVVESIQEVFWITDPAKNQILYISPGFEPIWGRSCESLYQSPSQWLEAIHPDDLSRISEALSKQVRGEYDEEYRITRPDGSARWIHDRAFPIRNEMGEVYRVVGVAADITERKNAERLALRSQRLESIGTLAGGVAHDLNNALAPILMGVEMLKMKYPQRSDILDIFQSSAKRGAEMVRQLLNFAKGAEGDRVSIQASLLIDELQTLIHGSFPKNIELLVNCDPKLPTVLGDVTQLHQILLNLCVNARDAMPNGGTLTLEARQVDMDAAVASTIPDAKAGHYLALLVRDTGTGISPEILDRMFEPFFTTKAPDSGTGLGLATVLGIVKGHGGFLQVDSHPGQGSTFTAYLPGNAGGKIEQAPKLEPVFRGRGETILFVDDEPALRDVARMVLRRLNFKSLIANDGAAGLILAAEHRTELHAVVTDMHMPHMDGLDFVRKLRLILPDIPVIVSSGLMEEKLAGEFKELGVTARLDKPFSEVQLAGKLKALFAESDD